MSKFNKTGTEHDKSAIVVFSHGMESSPFGKKILALVDVAQKHGFQTESIDYRDVDDPEERVKRLLAFASEMNGPFILVGSSMGGYVSLRASSELNTLGLFLMAPAVGLIRYGLSDPEPHCEKMTIVHAWDDEVIPVRNVIDYSEQFKAELHLVNSDHRLCGQVYSLCTLFDKFLKDLVNPCNEDRISS